MHGIQGCVVSINFILGHVCDQVGCVFYCISKRMEDKKFEQLMNELRKTCKKLNASITKVKHEVATAQERAAKDLSQKLNRSSY